MKKTLLIIVAVSFSVSLFSQNRALAPAGIRNYSIKAQGHHANEFVKTNNSTVLDLPNSNAKVFFEEQIGSTTYDLMTNRSCYNRLYLYPDGTIGAVWTFSALTSWADRGTGYNYFDGTAWQPEPTTRIESIRTGFPSYSPIGTGELVVAHSADQLVMSKRDVKGTGAWTETLIPYTALTEPTWPRVCVVGNNIHIICVDFTSAKLWYFRSTDGGTTWDKQGEEIPEVASTLYPNGFDADAYEWASPVGNTIAFLVGDKATDLVLMKSTDNGNTWTKTIVFQHPYPLYTDAVLTPDTPYVCDASHAITLDASGNAIVAFGLSRFLNDNTSDGTYSWFPGVDGIAFWKEGYPTFTSANPDDIYNQCKLVGYLQDIDNSGVVLDNYTSTSIADYQVSTTSMPQITIASDGNLYLIFRSLVETMMSGGGQFFSHIWGRKSTDGGITWTEFIDLTGDGDHAQVECIFPSMSPTTDGRILYTYMSDMEPGTNLGGDADPIGTSFIMFATDEYADFSNTDVECIIQGKNEINLSGNVNIYPNPVLNNMNVTFSFNKETNIKMTVFNSVGSIVINDSFVANGRGESNQINVKELPVGIYLVKFETASGTYTQKITKQ